MQHNGINGGHSSFISLMPIMLDMEEVSQASRVHSPFMFAKLFSDYGRVTTLPPAPPPSIIDDADGMAHIAPDIELDTSHLDAALMRLIRAVMKR